MKGLVIGFDSTNFQFFKIPKPTPQCHDERVGINRIGMLNRNTNVLA